MQDARSTAPMQSSDWGRRFVGALTASPILTSVVVAALVPGLCAFWLNKENQALVREAQEAEAERRAAPVAIPVAPAVDRDFAATLEEQRSLNDLTNQAGKVAERNNVSLLSVELTRREPSAASDLVGARYTLAMVGAYPTLKTTLAELWASHGNWQIRSLSMNRIPRTDRVELKLQIVVLMK